jgi:Zn ribbon nucleic-acid-binding protein
MPHLASCPFCDGEAADATVLYSEETQATNEWDQNLFFYVSCVRCGSCNRGLVGHKTPEAARRHWNTRASIVSVDYQNTSESASVKPSMSSGVS